MKQFLKSILTLKFKTMAKQNDNNNNNENNEKEVNLSEVQQKKLIDALVNNTSKMKILKTQLYLNDTHFICEVIAQNEKLLNSIK